MISLCSANRDSNLDANDNTRTRTLGRTWACTQARNSDELLRSVHHSAGYNVRGNLCSGQATELANLQAHQPATSPIPPHPASNPRSDRRTACQKNAISVGLSQQKKKRSERPIARSVYIRAHSHIRTHRHTRTHTCSGAHTTHKKQQPAPRPPTKPS